MTAETILNTETIETILNEIESQPEISLNPYAFARAIEQAVLQSPEIQALRKDAAMLDWLVSQESQMQSMARPNGGSVMYRVGWPDDGEYSVDWYSCPRAAISAAMEQQK